MEGIHIQKMIEHIIEPPQKERHIFSLGLNHNDKEFLKRKYMKQGMNYRKARERINGVNDRMKNLVRNMKDKKKTDLQIETRFKTELGKLYQE